MTNQPPYGPPPNQPPYGPPPNQPPYGPQGYQQPWPPQQPPKKKRRKWPWVLAAIVVLIIIIVAVNAGSNDDNSNTASNTTTADPAAPAAPAAPAQATGIGSPVRDGKFEFVVTGVDPGQKTVGDNPYFQATAQGQFIVVHLRVTNIGNQPQTFFSSNQRLFIGKQRFDNNTTAEIALQNNPDPASISGINPGNSLDTLVVFDVPQGSAPTSIELHDSAFSGGAKVSLQ